MSSSPSPSDPAVANSGGSSSFSLVGALLDALPVPIFYKDTDGLYLGVNHAWETFTGQTNAELVGRSTTDLFDAEAAKIYRDSDMALLARGGTEVYETTMVRADGQQRDIIVHKAIFTDDEGNTGGIVGQLLDVTERNKAEAAAKQASVAKGEFLANMSHELRTPMNGVIGMTSLLLDTSLDDEQSEFVNTIRTSGESLLSVINDILDFSKIEAGMLELDPLPFSLRNCIEDALDIVAYAAGQKGLDLAYAVDHSLPDNYIGDPTRIRQVLNNLLSNACKFTESGEIVVEVEVRERTDDAMHLVLNVIDTGLGIPEDRLHRLFRSFSQVDASTTRRFGGTGLGLAISKELAQIMGGDLTVTSVYGQGSTFALDLALPLAEDQTPLRYQRGFEVDLAETKVLVVDDNKTNRRILEKQLTAWNMQPTLVDGGPEALRLVREGADFDVALLDMQMPMMDGVALAKCLGSLRPEMPLALLSSIGQVGEADGALFDARMTKPVKPSALFDSLMGIFDRRSGGEEAAPAADSIDETFAEEHPMRILLAEDNMVNQKVAVGLLGRLGYRVDVVGNGLEAVQAVERQDYDVVLMDVHMPEMGGPEATAVIRSAARGSASPWIIALTADAMAGARENYLAAGMNDYVTKPLGLATLMEALGRVPVPDPTS